MKTSKSLATKFVAGEPYSSSRFCGKIIQKHSYNWAKIQKEHLQLYYAIAARLLMIIIANENKRSFSFCDILRNQPRYYRQKSQELWYFVLKIVLTYLLWEKKNLVIQNVFLRSQKQFIPTVTRFWTMELSPCWSVLDFWKINLEKLSSTNWIFSLFRTGFLLPV